MSQIPYTKLLREIRKVMEKGTDSAREAAAWHMVRQHWNVGRLVQDHFLITEEPSADNARNVERLGKDMHRPTTHFYTDAKFYRLYPVCPKASRLSWSHYEYLIKIPDTAQRRVFEQRAIKERIAAKLLYRLIQEDKKQRKDVLPLDEPAQATPQLAVVRGKLHHYKFVTDDAITLDPGFGLVDAGFHRFREVYIGKNRKYHSGNIVRAVKEGEAFSGKTATYDKSLLYTYKAFVKRVVDADTQIFMMDCGFRSWMEEKVRLRGIDTPELNTALGRKAKEFVENRLSKVKFVVIKTYKEGKFGRYLADVFYLPGEDNPAQVAAQGTFLNQELLDQGLADFFV